MIRQVRSPAGWPGAWLLAGLLVWCCAIGSAWSAQADAAPHPAGEMQTAPVKIDGKILFHLRGASAYPAERRAAEVRAAIIQAARDESLGPDAFRIEESADFSAIYAGQILILRVFDADAELESLQRQVLSKVYLNTILETITTYRDARSGAELARNTLYALAVTAVLALLGWGLWWAFRKLHDWIERNVKKEVDKLASKSHQLIHAGTIWGLIAGLVKLVRALALLALAYFYLNTVLGLFPWTRPAARVLLRLVLDPLQSLWAGFLTQLPNLVFLVVLWFVVRYLLKVIRAFFRGVGSGRIKLQNFERDWAGPTYKLVRILVIALAVVLAYPYIPGSESAAFKGVSVFLGVLLSLGSSSFIANMIAGLTMTYRGAFREGDLIKVGDTIGTVQDMKLMVTRLRTAKNESVILPNSNVLNTEVVNFSQLADTEGLIVHSTVGIGYDAPWRQVEALLLEAVSRTEGLKSEPPPFVLQSKLGDFAVDYQLNAYWSGKGSLLRIKSDLHANIQDVFNEYGVQIMSPAYENDPETPKTVPPEKWYEAPAKKPEG